MKISKKKILLIFLIMFSVICGIVPGTTLKVNAECYKTTTGNNCTIKYNDDGTKVTSITINFSYVDSVDMIARNNTSNRIYNLIFTKDSTKKGVTTAGQENVNLENLATRLEITDAIYSSDSVVTQDGVIYTTIDYEEGENICNTSIARSRDEKCTLITGTYTLTDTAILDKLEPNTTYYALLCSAISGDYSGSWYTGVSVNVLIDENKSFVILDENTKPEIIVTDNHNPVQVGDILTAVSDAGEITYSWYYDDNEDGITDEESLIGSGETYSVTSNDLGHKIICVAIQNKDKSGNELPETNKPMQVSLPVFIGEQENGKTVEELNQKEYKINSNTNSDDSISFKALEGEIYSFDIKNRKDTTDEDIQHIVDLFDDPDFTFEILKNQLNKIIDYGEKAASGKGDLLKLYEMYLYNNGNEIHEAEGGFKLKLKMTDDMKGYDSYKLIYIAEDGTTEEAIELTKNEEYLEGTLQHLSIYALVGSKTETITGEDTTTAPGIIPQAGVDMAIVFIIITVFVGTIIVGVKYSKFRDIK